jgi:hypothetical protein
MPSLSLFGQFINATRDTKLTDASFLINEAQSQSYVLSHFLRKSSPFRNIRGGTRITERVKVTDQGNFAEYNPGDQRVLTRINTMRSLNFEWAFNESNISYTEQEIMLNAGDGDVDMYKNLKKSFRQDALSDHVNGLESRMFAAPNFALQETVSASDRRKAYSIPCFITENGLAPVTVVPATSTTTAFTTLAGQDPANADNTWFRNQVSSYDSTSWATISAANTGILAAMDDMDVKLNFKPVPQNANGTFQEDSGDKIVIFTNRIGLNYIRQLYRTGQDTYTSGRGGNGGTDAAYSRVQYNGREIEYVTALDTEPLGGTNNSANAGGTFTSTGVAYVNPRYFWVNTKHLFPVFHKQRFMYEREAMDGGVMAPDTEVIFYNTWWQFVCNSRRRNGIVRPASAN